MTRRVWLGQTKSDGRPIAEAEGVAGETFDTEVWQPYGLSAGIEGEGVLISHNGEADNHTALPATGDRVADAGTVLIYYGENTQIVLSDDTIEITVPSGRVTIGAGKITTDLDIETTGDVKAGGISLRGHKHGGVMTGGGVTGPSLP